MGLKKIYLRVERFKPQVAIVQSSISKEGLRINS